MSEAIANAVRRMWFSFTNNDKAHNAMRADCKERQAVSIFQVAGASNDLVTAAKGTEKGAQYVNALTDTLKASEKASKLLEWTGKGVNLASKAVNPVLCLASLDRAFSAKDKKSALIQEGGAMLGMFAFEGVAKSALKLAPVNNTIYNGVAKWLVNGLKSTGLLSKLPNNKYTAILKGLAFVAASCIGFGLGKSTGKLITKHTTEKDFQMKKMLLEQQQIAKLTAPKDGLKANLIS